MLDDNVAVFTRLSDLQYEIRRLVNAALEVTDGTTPADLRARNDLLNTVYDAYVNVLRAFDEQRIAAMRHDTIPRQRDGLR